MVRMVAVGEETGRGVGIHGDVEVVEGKRDAGPQRFDVGFLAGPSGEKRGGALAFGQGAEGRVFVHREELFHEPGEILWRDHLFDVDTDGVVAGYGDEGEVAGVGEVELEPGVVGRGERGFAVGVGREDQLGGGKVQVTAEDIAHCAVGDDEAFAVLGEAEACGAGVLGGRKRVGKALYIIWRDVPVDPPDMDGICREVEGVGRGALHGHAISSGLRTPRGPRLRTWV